MDIRAERKRRNGYIALYVVAFSVTALGLLVLLGLV
jgi:hypothetical protein